MKKNGNQSRLLGALITAILSLSVAACTNLGSSTADLGLGAAGGAVGYKLSGGKMLPTAAGAVLGYAGSQIAQARIGETKSTAEQLGYDRAMNQAVKQQYWIIQEQQRSRSLAGDCDSRVASASVPEEVVDGALRNARVEFRREQP